MSILEVKGIAAAETEGVSIRDISFCIDEKGIYGFFGKDGDTLTLLSRVLCGAREADVGEIYYHGNELFSSEKKTAQIKKKIGYVPKNSYFSKDMTLVEALDLVGRAKGVSADKCARQIKEALELTGLTDKSDQLFEALTPSEKKRACYASSLLGNPDIVIIDEPFSAVDAAAKDELKKLIAMLGRMKTVILCSKNPTDTDELCSHAAILDGGELLAFEPIDELLARINKTVNAILRVKEKNASHSALMDALSQTDGIISVSAAKAVGGITDIRLECSTRDGMTSKISELVEQMGGEVVSLRFVSLGIGDVMTLLCSRNAEV